MSQMFKVAMREIRERGRSKAFIISTIVTALLVAALIIVPGLIGGGTTEYNIGSVGTGNAEIIDAAQRLAVANDEPGEEPSVVFHTTEFATRAEAEAALEAGEVDAVMVDGTEVIVASMGWGGSSLLSLLGQAAATVELERLISEEGESAVRVIEVMTTPAFEVTTLSGDGDADSTRVVIAYAGLMILYIAVLLYGNWILTGVTEEKSSRVVEVLLAAVKPWQLLAGKILGIGAMGIAQFIVAAVVALIAVQFSSVDLPQIDGLILANLLVWFVIGFLIFAVLYGAAGAMSSRTEDAQSVAFPMTIIAVVGLFVAFSALDDPTGPVATIATFIPVTAPFVVPVRVALLAIPIWQYVAALVICIVSIIGLALIAGRIYSGSLLRFGGRVKLREAWRAGAE